MSTVEGSRRTARSEDIELGLEEVQKQGLVGRTRNAIAAGKDRTIDAVQRNPYRSLAIAAGIGFVAGLMLKRR